MGSVGSTHDSWSRVVNSSPTLGMASTLKKKKKKKKYNSSQLLEEPIIEILGI